MQGSPPCEICTAVRHVVTVMYKYCVLACATTRCCMQMFYQIPSCTRVRMMKYTRAHTHIHTCLQWQRNYYSDAHALHHVVKCWKLDWRVLCSITCQYNCITHLILLPSIYMMHINTLYPANCHSVPISIIRLLESGTSLMLNLLNVPCFWAFFLFS